MVYPAAIMQRLAELRPASGTDREDASGKEVNFGCGSFVRFSLEILDGRVCKARFASNGCGYMVAIADLLAKYVAQKPLGQLHGLHPDELWDLAKFEFGVAPEARRDCIVVCISALRMAFLDYRSRQIEEFRGEKALICTCFAVTEETLESVVQQQGVYSVADVTGRCRAGGGCGSCTLMIQEILDNRLGSPLP